MILVGIEVGKPFVAAVTVLNVYLGEGWPVLWQDSTSILLVVEILHSICIVEILHRIVDI